VKPHFRQRVLFDRAVNAKDLGVMLVRHGDAAAEHDHRLAGEMRDHRPADVEPEVGIGHRMFERIRLGPGSTIALFLADGTRIVRHPEPNEERTIRVPSARNSAIVLPGPSRIRSNIRSK
jgi:hypothetical protein